MQQTQLVGPASDTRFRTEAPHNDDYVRGLSRCVLEALAYSRAPEVQRAARVIERDLTRGVANAYSWHALSRAVQGAGLRASLLSAINAVLLEINAARAA